MTTIEKLTYRLGDRINYGPWQQEHVLLGIYKTKAILNNCTSDLKGFLDEYKSERTCVFEWEKNSYADKSAEWAIIYQDKESYENGIKNGLHWNEFNLNIRKP